jgi:hypothetical protein
MMNIGEIERLALKKIYGFRLLDGSKINLKLLMAINKLLLGEDTYWRRKLV